MPVLSNPRWEHFCQEVAKGNPASNAYEAAYGSIGGAARTGGSRLLTNGDISARIAELLERGAKRAEVTIESLIGEAEAARVLAMSIDNPAAAVSAIREKGVLSGKRIEKAEHGKPGDFANLNDDELEKFIAIRQGAAGAGIGGAGTTNGQTGMRSKSNGVH